MTRLTVGQLAPAFETLDHFDKAVSLSALRGRKVLLSFYRYASCPMCNLRVNSIARRHAAWHAAGLEVIGVFQSSAKDIQRYVGRQDSPFAIVPDPGMVFYKSYGVETSWWGFLKAGGRVADLASAFSQRYLPGRTNGPIHRVPADFLLDEQGRLVECYYGKDAGDHLSFDIIERFVGP